MERFEKSLKALEAPENEPLNWLAGNGLRRHAQVVKGPHYLLNMLSRPRVDALAKWNAWIHEFRELLVNSEIAPAKATKDLQPQKDGGIDAEEKLRALLAEIQTPIVLNRLGFRDFVVVESAKSAQPDFLALLEGRRARIETKSLRQAQDLLGNIASDQWSKDRQKAPKRYGFNAVLRHSHRGRLSEAAEKRLRAIVDQLPKCSGTMKETLDGGVEIILQKHEAGDVPREIRIPSELSGARPEGRLAILSPFGPEFFANNVEDTQGLLLKSLSPIADSTRKFFGRHSFDSDSVNVVALRWEPPEFPYDQAPMIDVQQGLEQLFRSFDLNLRVVFFVEPPASLPLLKMYERGSFR